MTECVLMLGAMYLWYVATNINNGFRKANFVRGIFVLLSFLMYVTSIVLCFVTM